MSDENTATDVWEPRSAYCFSGGVLSPVLTDTTWKSATYFLSPQLTSSITETQSDLFLQWYMHHPIQEQCSWMSGYFKLHQSVFKMKLVNNWHHAVMEFWSLETSKQSCRNRHPPAVTLLGNSIPVLSILLQMELCVHREVYLMWVTLSADMHMIFESQHSLLCQENGQIVWMVRKTL